MAGEAHCESERLYYTFRKGRGGLVPAPTANDIALLYILRADATWGPGGSGGYDSDARSAIASAVVGESSDFSSASSQNLSQSVLISTAQSKADAGGGGSGTDSVARSSIASAVVLESLDISAASSQNLSQSVLISTADSKGTSSGTQAAAADSKAVSIAATLAAEVEQAYATFVLGIGQPITVGVNKTNSFIVAKARTIVKAYLSAKTGPTGADLVVDIKKNGTTIWSTTANRLKIVAGQTYGVQTLFDVTNLAENDLLTIDVVQVGSVVAGQDVTVVLAATQN